MGSLHATCATGNLDRRFGQLAKVTLLIIDDFGLKPMRPSHDEDFHVLTDNKVSSYIRCNPLIDASRRQPRSGNVSS